MTTSKYRKSAMARIYTFFIVAKNRFPVDMLRYDRCWFSNDSAVRHFIINTPECDPSPSEHIFAMQGVKEPTIGRWESFSCKVFPSLHQALEWQDRQMAAKEEEKSW